MALDDGYLQKLRDWALKNRGEPVIADDDLRCSDVGELVDEILKLRAVVAELGHPCNWDAVLRTAKQRNDNMRRVEELEKKVQKTREELGDELDRIVVDWYDKLKEVEAERDDLQEKLDGLIKATAEGLIPSVVERLGVEASRTKELDDLKAKIKEIKENSHQSPGNCSGCGNPLVPMWVCEGVEDPECGGHDG